MLSKYHFLAVLLLLIPEITAARIHQYEINIDNDINIAAIKVCFDGEAPEYLSVENKSSSHDLIEFPYSANGKIEIQGRYWYTKGLPNDACLAYQISLKRHHAKRTKESAKRKNIAYMEENSWLWLPEIIDKKENVQLNFRLPEWAEISAPWYYIPNSSQSYLVGNQPQEWGYTLLIGDIDMTRSPISKDKSLNIATIKTLKNKPQVIKWLTDTAKSLESYLGVYPTPQTQIIVIPKSKGGPVPWGDVRRGNGFGIRFVVVPKEGIKSFYTDWTASHEFSHQLLPNIKSNDKWLAEGLASYIQYVLMAQSKVISKEKAWAKLYAGFQRGENGTKKTKREPLSVTSSRNKKGSGAGRTMRIYWSGALYFLQSDVALREQSEGRVGLNDVLLKLNQCCIESANVWSGITLTRKLDELSNTKIFESLYLRYSNDYNFPDYEQTFHALGITVEDTKQDAPPASNFKIKPGSYADVILNL